MYKRKNEEYCAVKIIYITFFFLYRCIILRERKVEVEWELLTIKEGRVEGKKRERNETNCGLRYISNIAIHQPEINFVVIFITSFFFFSLSLDCVYFLRNLLTINHSMLLYICHPHSFLFNVKNNTTYNIRLTIWTDVDVYVFHFYSAIFYQNNYHHMMTHFSVRRNLGA